MEAMTFPRYSPDDIVSYLRSHVLGGAEARNLVKGDVFGNPKVGEGEGVARGAVLGAPPLSGSSLPVVEEGLCVP